MYYVTISVYYRRMDFQTINPYAGPSLISWDLDELYHFDTAYVPEIGEILMIDKMQDAKSVKKQPFVVKEKIRLDSTHFAIIVEDYKGLEFEIVDGILKKKELQKLN